MIDYFALGLTHFLILVAVIRLAGNDMLDDEPRMYERRRRPRNKEGKSGDPRA